MLDEKQILNIIANELSYSVGGSENEYIEGQRQAALGAYLGQPDGKETEGRSKIVSTDVADAIEWIMPDIMKAFTQNNEVVTFDPCYSGDEKQAELESKYVYDILMKDNTGFITLHQFFKDALMQKNGFVKVYYSTDVTTTNESYTGLTEVEAQMVLADPEIELIENTIKEGEITTYDIKVKRTIDSSKICVDSIAPENIRVHRSHSSVDLSYCKFSAHVESKTAGELIAMGFDKEFVDEIPSSEVYESDEDYRFYLQGESTGLDSEGNPDPSARIIEVSECYIMIDINEDGIPEYMKITCAGGSDVTHILEMEELDSNPLVSATAILMSHKLFGLSIYDRLKQIQEQKTTLWRNIFDNMYLQNNQRTVILENQVNIDDLLISRPGGIIRAKTPNAVMPLATPPISGDAYRMMDYLDQVRAGRSGASPEGPANENVIGDRVGSQGVEKLLSKKEELVGLMIRVFAETGIKPICYKIREEVIKHQDIAKDYMYRGNWVKINPLTWRKKRATSTVRVGTGSGNRQEQQAAISQLMLIQEKILANPSQALVNEQRVFDAIDDFAKFSGLPGAGRYFLDPESPEGQQQKQQVDEQNKQSQEAQMKEQQAMLETQTKIADAEVQKAQAQMMNVQLKNQVDSLKAQIDNQDNMSNAELSALKQQLEEAKAELADIQKSEELAYKYWQTEFNGRLQLQLASQNDSGENNE
jgi:hypothetical protein